MLRYSRFNHLTRIPGEDNWALVNFASGCAYRLDAVQKAVFDIAPQLRPDVPLVRAWLARGFLVDEGFDEVAAVRDRVFQFQEDFASGADRRSLEIVVCVTSACNFACPYCFQHRRGGHMTPEVRDALVRFVERRLASGRHDHLGIAWFGGEPLLACDIIDELSSRFMELAERFGVGYDAMIHTNGYLLDQAMVDFLEARNVRTAIVPIDGMGAAHDATRHLRGGGPTFERIMDNLRSIHTSMFVNVRNNLHAGSLEHFDELREMVDRIARDNGTNIRCSPSKVVSTDAGRARCDTTQTISEEQYEQVLAKTDLPAKLHAFSPTLAPCQAALPNELHVDELGYIYPHCSFYSVDPAYAVGNLLDEDGGGPDAWMSALIVKTRKLCFPGDQPRCLECKFLPCCLGGCPAQRIEEGKPTCPSKLFDPDTYAIDRCRDDKPATP